MIIPDVNLLLYATISAFPHHERARQWWMETINTERIGLGTPAIFGFLRIATNPRIIRPPMSFDVAAGYLQEWLSRPNVDVVAPGTDHVNIALELLREIGTAGNLTTDAQLAALAIERGAELRSHDTDFGRFRGVACSDPLA